MEEKNFDRALQFAIKAHAGQKRKGSETPYLLHPLEVCTICGSMSASDALLSAALLHDTVEDTSVTMEDIEANFSGEIVELVKSETEDKRNGIAKSDTWDIRKKETLDELKATDNINIKKLWLADKLSNMRSTYSWYLREGVVLWNHFNQKDPKKQEWYYRSVLEYTSELKDYPAWQEYKRLVNAVFGGTDELH